MRAMLIQLSDIHLQDGDDPIFERANRIVDAVRNVDFELDACVLVLSGDVANRGSEDQFLLGMDLVGGLQRQLSTELSIPVHVVAVPGNHDCNLGAEQGARNIVLDKVLSDPEPSMDPAVIQLCTGVQNDFFAFREAVCGRPTADGRLYYEYEIRVGEESLLFRCLNTAWVSRIPEVPGKMVYPASLVPTDKTSASVVVAVLHHPFEWLEPNNRRKVRQQVEMASDIILTGHEHVHTRRAQELSTGERNEFIEGGVLQERGDSEISSFNVIVLDTQHRRQRFWHFAWNEDLYVPEASDPDWEDFQVNQMRQEQDFECSEEFSAFLRDLGVTIRHPEHGVVQLQDVYVHPDFRELRQDLDVELEIPGEELFDLVLRTQRMLITGPERAGKTSTAKMLYQHFRDHGIIPLYIDGTKFHPLYDDRLYRHLYSEFERQYGEALLERYRQLPSSRRAVIIDSFHLLKIRADSEDRFYDMLDRFADHLIVIANDLEHHLAELSDPKRILDDRQDFTAYRLLPFGYARRSALAERWFLLSQEARDDEELLAKRLIDAERRMKLVIGYNFIPPFPIFILSLLQVQEASAEADLRGSSYGYYYELLVRNALAAGVVPVQFDVRVAYLSFLAYHLFRAGKREASLSDLRHLHEQFEEKHDVRLNFEPLIRDFGTCRILGSIGDAHWFRYKYIEYYFVANYIREHLDETEIREYVKALSRDLTEDAANVLLFLTHLSRDPVIIGSILEKARQLFTGFSPARLEDDVLFLTYASPEETEVVFEDGPLAEMRRRRLEAEDRAAAEQRSDSRAVTQREVEDEEFEEAQRIAGDLGAAFRTLQILGQILKNFPGRLTGEQKLDIAAECYNLGLRTLTCVIHMVQAIRGDLEESVMSGLRIEDPYVPSEELRRRAKLSVFGLIQSTAYAFVQRIAFSVGAPHLGETYERILRAEPSVAVKLVDLSVRLDQIQDHFPAKRIVDFGDDVRDRLLPYTLLRQVVVNHFYLFPVDMAVKQSVCAKLDISYKRVRASNPKKMIMPARGAK